MSEPRHGFKALSLLLQYPSRELYAAQSELDTAVQSLKGMRGRHHLQRFLKHLATHSLSELQEHYVSIFDFNKRTSLYLSFHGYGDRRQRGAAMGSLKRAFSAFGLPLVDGELPDYLPVLLEFAAFAPAEAGVDALNEFRAEIELVRSGLHELETPYSHLLDALCALLPKLREEVAERIQRLAFEGPPSEEVGLEPFGPPEAMPETACRVTS